MALTPKGVSMLSNVTDKLSKVNPTNAMVWNTVAKEYCNTYLSSAQNAGMGPATAVPGVALCGIELIEATAVPIPTGQLTAIKMAKAFQNAFLTFLSVYQTGPPVTAPGFPGLINAFTEIMSAPTADPTSMARGICKALDEFTVAAQVIGVVPGTPPVPFAGSIS